MEDFIYGFAQIFSHTTVLFLQKFATFSHFVLFSSRFKSDKKSRGVLAEGVAWQIYRNLI